MTDHERRYTDRELSEIIRSAAGPAHPPPALQGPRTGLTLSEIQVIAAEVGVPSTAVERAARQLPAEAETGLVRVLGGAARVQLAFTVPGAPEAATGDRVIESMSEPG